MIPIEQTLEITKISRTALWGSFYAENKKFIRIFYSFSHPGKGVSKTA